MNFCGRYFVSLVNSWFPSITNYLFSMKKNGKMLIYNCLTLIVSVSVSVCVCVCMCVCVCVFVCVKVRESEKKKISKNDSLFLFGKHEYQSHDKTILWLSIHKSRFQMMKKQQQQQLHNKNIFKLRLFQRTCNSVICTIDIHFVFILIHF